MKGSARRAARGLVAGCAVIALLSGSLGAACRPSVPLTAVRTVFFRNAPVATVEEHVTNAGAGLRSVKRTTELVSGERIELHAVVEANGHVREATYRRPGKRTVQVVGRAVRDVDTGVEVTVRQPVVLLDLLHLAHPSARLAGTVVDLASGERLDAWLDRESSGVVLRDLDGGVLARANAAGQRIGPGAFAEGDSAPAVSVAPVDLPLAGTGHVAALRLLDVSDVIPSLRRDGDGQRGAGDRVEFVTTSTVLDPGAGAGPAAPHESTTVPELFVEHAAPAVRAFAARHTQGRDPLADAAALAAAVHPLLDPDKSEEPPSAVRMLHVGGDCDGAAALVAASLRAAGHRARPVVGYRRVDDRYIPHAWAEVWTPRGWVLVDPAVPAVGARGGAHLKLFDGLGGALTMGRVLGRLRVEVLRVSP